MLYCLCWHSRAVTSMSYIHLHKIAPRSVWARDSWHDPIHPFAILQAPSNDDLYTRRNFPKSQLDSTQTRGGRPATLTRLEARELRSALSCITSVTPIG